jgi:hypothetical protein
VLLFFSNLVKLLITPQVKHIFSEIILFYVYGPLGQIRTGTTKILSFVTLPVGLRGEIKSRHTNIPISGLSKAFSIILEIFSKLAPSSLSRLKAFLPDKYPPFLFLKP